jgi:hypothetical protein
MRRCYPLTFQMALVHYSQLVRQIELQWHSTTRYVFTNKFSYTVIGLREAKIAQWYRTGLRARWSGVRVPARAENFSLHHRVQNGYQAQSVSYSMGTRSSFSGVKATGAWSWPLTSIQCRRQRMSVDIPPLPQYAFMMWCSVKITGTTLPFIALSRQALYKKLLQLQWVSSGTDATFE